MRYWVFGAAAAVCLPAAPAWATDHLLFGAPESWVVPVTSPAPPAADTSAITILLDDEQAMLRKGQRKFYSESVYRINSPQGLDNGNITLTWDPACETLTVNKLLIRRGSQVIDVLKSGQKFTTMRRETNLDAGMLDGQLTGSLLPEGLQVGDIIELAVTYDRRDPATKDSTEIELATFNDNPVGRGFARLTWPSSLPVTFRTAGGLPAPKVIRKDGFSTIEYDLSNIEPLVLPSSAPGRFREGRALDASNFASWAEIAALMKPYFDTAAVIPASGPLRVEVEKIRRLPGGDKVRAAAALELVQNSVRYVALSMGTGGYVPASAETTWSRRFGDCKAKTALLLGILHELHIDAEAVLANTDGSDGLDRRQPELGWFDHVLVRAHIAGKDYWLDGTRSGDTSLDRLRTPAYDWGLPLVSKAALVRMVPEPFTEPTIEVALSIDAHEGIHLPAPTTIVYTFRGDTARQANIKYNEAAPSQRDHLTREFFKKVAEAWTSSIISLDPDKVDVNYDAKTGEMRYSFIGTAKLDWSDSDFYVQFGALAFKPDFERTDGVNRDAPVAVEYPSFVKMTESIRLPKAFLSGDTRIPDVDTTLVGIQYHRHAAFVGDAFTVETSERSIAPEVPYAEALSSSAALRDLNSKQLSIYVPDNYVPNDRDMTAWLAEKLASASEFVSRGNSLLDSGRKDEAIADFTSAIALDKMQSVAYADRGIAYTEKGDKDRARADFDAAAAIDPKNAVMLRGRGILAEQQEKWDDAVQAFTASLVSDPESNFAVGNRALAYAELQKDDQALADANVALEKDPSWVAIRRLRASALLQRHQCGDVIKDAAILASDTTDVASLATAARLYVACQQRNNGISLFDKALAAKPTAILYINRAELRLPSDHAGKLADFDAALKLEPGNSEALLDKGFYLAEDGKYAQALNYYDRAVKSDHSIEAGANRAVSVYKIGRTAEAEEAFASLRARAKTALELNDLCWIKATAGVLLDSALQDCRDALKMKPGTGPFLDSLGMVLLKLGKTDEALDAYNQAIAKNVGADSLMGRAFVYLHKGERGPAEADAAAARKQAANIDDVFADYGLHWDEPAPVANKASATAGE